MSKNIKMKLHKKNNIFISKYISLIYPKYFRNFKMTKKNSHLMNFKQMSKCQKVKMAKFQNGKKKFLLKLRRI
jgi:hypothetical protein